MDKLHKDILIKRHRFLLENVAALDCIDYLYQEEIITAEDSQNIRSKAADTDKMRYLLETLPKKGQRAYGVFKKALEEAGNKKFVLDELESAEKIIETGMATTDVKSSTPNRGGGCLNITNNTSSHIKVEQEKSTPVKLLYEKNETTERKLTDDETESTRLKFPLDELDSAQNDINSPLAKRRKIHEETEKENQNRSYSESRNGCNSTSLESTQVASAVPEVKDNKDEGQGYKDIEKKALELHPFQRELAEACEGGANKLIISATNTGKTYVAMAIIKEHLERLRKQIDHNRKADKKIIFLVPKVILATQQHRKFCEYLHEHMVCHITGENEKKFTLQQISDIPFDIIIMTPQILVNSLEASNENMQSISLLLFDECHHARGGHPMSVIMKKYLSEKLSNSSIVLPQIVGLTATIGIGKSRTLDSAVDYIKNFCASMDSAIKMVEREQEDLENHIKQPPKDVTENAGSRINIDFQKKVEDIMAKIEEKFKALAASILESAAVTDPQIQKIKFPPKATAEYEQYLVTLEKNVTEMKNKRRSYNVCLRQLKIYNKALLLYFDCHATDALLYIEEKLSNERKASDHAEEDELESSLFDIFKETKDILKTLAKRDRNPKLEMLLGIIIDKLGKDDGGVLQDGRALVYVETRALTNALERFLKNNEYMEAEGLADKVDKLVGRNTSSEKQGMTILKSSQAVKDFKEGITRILICTAAANEGLDIPQCNLTIVYEQQLTAEQEFQTKGRARALKSMRISLSSSCEVLTRSVKNKHSIDLMEKATREVLNTTPETLRGIFLQIQRELITSNKKEKLSLNQAEPSFNLPKDGHKLICAGCESFICNASDIRVLNYAHHIVVDSTFKDRFRFGQQRKPEKIGDNLVKDIKIHCAKSTCGGDWGVKFILKGPVDKSVPVLRQGGFIIDEGDGTRYKPRIWKDVKFAFEATNVNELAQLCNDNS